MAGTAERECFVGEMMGFLQEQAGRGVEELDFTGDDGRGEEGEEGEVEVFTAQPFVEPGGVKGVSAPDEMVPGKLEEGEGGNDLPDEGLGELLEGLVVGQG